jgi:predicted secreted Zn-dependent protease
MIHSAALPGKVDWRISRTCDGGACVSVARVGEYIMIGNTSSPEGPVTCYTISEWQEFLQGVKLGDFDDIS